MVNTIKGKPVRTCFNYHDKIAKTVIKTGQLCCRQITYILLIETNKNTRKKYDLF